MATDLRIRWHLELVDTASSKLLRQDRAIRSSINQTERARKSLATAAVRSGDTQLRSALRVAGALRDEGKAADRTKRDVLELNRAQANALGVGDRLASSASRVAGAYRGQADAIRGVVREQRRLSRTSSSSSASGGGATAGISHAAAAATGAGTRLAGAAAGGAATGVVALGVGAAIAERQIAGFDATLDGARGKLLVTKKAMEPLRALAIKLGADTNYSAREAAAAIDELAAQGFSVNKILKILPGTLSLAAASGADLAQAATIQTETLHAFGLEAKDAAKVADVLAQISNRSAAQIDDLQESLKYIAPVAKASGQSLEDMGAAVGLLANVGIKGSQAGTTLRTAMVRLSNPTEKARDALAKLHLSAGDLSGPKGLLSLPNIMGKLAKGSEGVSKNQRNAAISTIFGREALSGMVALLEKGEPALRKEADALKDSEGAAKRAATIMRDNVSGAWDNFTGSVESATISLLTRFQPAIKDSLNGLGDLVDRGAKAGGNLLGKGISAGGELVAGVRGQRQAPVARNSLTAGARGGLGALSRVPADDRSKFAKVGDTIRGVATKIASVASDAGKQLIDAFKPALPFFQNVLLPLLKGIGLGILGSVVAAFKVVIPVIKVVATVLGFLGTKAAPLKGVFEGIGKVIGFVLGGPILKGIGLLSKLGTIFKVVGGAAKVLALPLKLVEFQVGLMFKVLGRVPGALSVLSKAFGAAGRAVTRLPGALAAGAGAMLHAAGALASAAVRGLANLPARLAVFAVSAAHAVSRNLGRLAGLLVDVGVKAGQRFLSTLRDQFGKLPGALKDVVGGLAGIGKAIVGAVIAGIKSAPGAIGDAIKSLVPAKFRGLLPYRNGGNVNGYRGGGLVTAAVSPGELVAYGGASWTVPGTPTAADSVLTALPAGAAVYTSSGQAMLASGASPDDALRYQAPHFRAGGIVPGKYTATSYGPPWGGIQGTGVTRTGVNLKGNPHIYGVAVDPDRIALGSRVYAWPNPFGYNGRFQAFDTGGAIKGNRIDFYDWRGRQRQNAWGRRTVTVSTKNRHARGGDSNTFTGGGGSSGSDPGVSILAKSSRRAGLLGDAFQQGVGAGQAGLIRSAKGRLAGGNPLLSAIRDADRQASSSGSSSKRYTPGSRGSGGSSSRGSGWPTTPHGKVIGRPYAGTHTLGNWPSDNAIDIGVPMGSRALAVRDGKITRVGGSWRGGASRFDGLQAYLNGTVFYTHLKSLAVRVGQSVRKGQTIGRTGAANGVPHLHIGYRPPSKPPGFRRGGIVGGVQHFRTGGATMGALNAGVKSAIGFSGGSLEALDVLIGTAMQSRLEALRRSIERKVQAGGPAKVVKRYQAILDVIDFELGRRIGELQDKVAAASRGAERNAGQVDRDLRRVGVDPSSAAGLSTIGARTLRGNTNAAKANVANLKTALARAKRHGDRELIRDLTTQLEDAQDALDEALVAQIENARNVIRQQAQERVDVAGLGMDVANANLSILDAFQRQNGYSDTAGASTQRAGYINSLLIPALNATREALLGQLNAAAQTGDAAGVRSAQSALLSNSADLANAIADAAELVRNAAVQSAQSLVDWWSSYISQRQTMLSGVDVATRLGSLTGTAAGAELGANLGVGRSTIANSVLYGVGGGVENLQAGSAAASRYRAQAIQTWLVPILQTQQTALEGKLGTLRGQGRWEEARQAELELQSNALELASAIADAGELLRDAAVQAAQDLTDEATHRATLADAGLQRLELEQKLAGSFDAGGQQRADYIKSTILPALQGELSAILERERVARENNMVDELRKTIEEEAGKRNEILQAQLDAQEETAANTAPRRPGGNLGFTFGDMVLTDSLAASFNGA